MGPKVTLERVVTLARQNECIKTQQSTIRGEVSQENIIEVVRDNKKDFQHPSSQRMKLCGIYVGVKLQPSTVPSQRCHLPHVSKKWKLQVCMYVEAHLRTRSSVRMVETENSNFLDSSDVSTVETNKWTLNLNQREVSTQVPMLL